MGNHNLPGGYPYYHALCIPQVKSAHRRYLMAKYKCEACGWEGKPLFMEPATRLCPKCKSIKVKKIKK